MYRFVVLVLGAMVVGILAKDDMPKGMPPCARVTHGGFECCKKEITKPIPAKKEDFHECMQLMKKPPNCDAEICLAKKRGLLSDDGSFDKKAMAALVEMQFENEPELADSVKENCINGDLSKFGPPDFCDLMKQKACVEFEIVKSCNEWNDEGGCNGMKDLAAECIKQFS